MATTDPGEQRGSPGGSRFAQTQWSVVLSAAGKGNPALAAQSLEHLCRIYWLPLYTYVRRQGAGPHDAQDLTQEFFARLLEKNFLGSIDEKKGRFRSFLLASLKHFLSNQRDRDRAQKRGGGQVPLSLDFSSAETQVGFQPVDHQTPDKAFEKQWALTLLEQTLARMRQEYSERGKAELFNHLKSVLTGDAGPGYASLAVELNLSEAAVKMAAHRLKQRYREVLRTQIAETVAHESEVEDELRQVMRALAH